jgi:hypothetical protein
LDAQLGTHAQYAGEFGGIGVPPAEELARAPSHVRHCVTCGMCAAGKSCAAADKDAASLVSTSCTLTTSRCQYYQAAAATGSDGSGTADRSGCNACCNTFCNHSCVHVAGFVVHCTQSIKYAARSEQDSRDLLQAAVEEQRRVGRQKSLLRRRGSLEVRRPVAL